MRRGVRVGPYATDDDDFDANEEIGSYDAVEAGEQLERFAEKIKDYADLIKTGTGSGASNLKARSGMRTLKNELVNVAAKLKELASDWNARMLGPDDEY